MDKGVRLRSVFVLLILVGLLIGSTSASATNSLFFNEAIETPDAENGVRTIELDASGNMFASYGTTLYKMSESGTILNERTFSKEIIATAISPDSTKLALTLKSGLMGQDSIFIVSTGDLSTLTSSDTTRTNAYILKWSPNGADLYANSPDDGIIQLDRDTLDEKAAYTNNHTGAMTCVDISGVSGMVLTADENGLVQLWDNDGGIKHQEIQIQSTILDCAFGDEDEFFSISTPTNGIRKWTFSGSELKPIDVHGAEKYHFTKTKNNVIIHKTTPTQHILVYDILNEVIVDQVTLFHAFDDFVMLFDEDESMTNIITNTKVNYVVKYGSEIQRIGIGESGIDTDGDGVPDSLDNDDDGDGIEDYWDLNCVDIGISCELLPDEDLIRSIDLNINETHLVVQQTFTLNKATSASIRDLSRLSIDNDIRLSSQEAQLFADTICANLDQDVASTAISSTISIENTSLNFSEIRCTIKEGMTLVPVNDRTSHIRYSISLVFGFETSQTLEGLMVEIENHRFTGTGSITELSDQHPIRISVDGPSIVAKEYVPWHVQEQTVKFDIEAIENTNEKRSTQNVLSSPVAIVVLLVGIFVIGFVAQRLYDSMKKSDYNINLDDEDDEDDRNSVDVEDDYEEDYSYGEEESFDDQSPEKVRNEPSARRPERRKPTKKSTKRVRLESKEATAAKDLLQQSSNEVVRIRRTRRSQHDTVTTKRRKLSDTQPIDSKPRKRRAVKRDVDDEEMDERLKRFVSESPEE